MQHGLRDLEAPDHPPGVVAHELVRSTDQVREGERFFDPGVALASREIVEPREDAEILVTVRLPSADTSCGT